jgi:predicted outer membrane repeat protein
MCSGTLTLDNTVVSGNSAPGGGGIYSESSGALTITHSTFSQNFGEVDGGGIEISAAPNFSITNSLFSANVTGGGGGGIENLGGTGTIVATRFVNNVAEFAGGIDDALGTVTASHVSFSGNVGQPDPDAAKVVGVTEPVSNPHGPAGSFTVTNLLDDGSAGSLRSVIEAADALPGPHTITFQAGLTGEIRLNGTVIDITEPLTIKGPGASKIAVDGRGISQIFDIDDGDPTTDSPVSISGLAFQAGESKTNGGAIFSAESLTLSHIVVTGSFTNADGGAVAVMALDTPGSTVKIIDSLLLKNDALGSGHASYGGGLAAFVAKSVTISGSLISGNNATYGGGVYAVVGTSGAGITISGTTFSGNVAHFGGGIMAGDPNTLATSKVQVLGSTFHGNQASNEGAGIFAGKGNFALQQSKFLENSSANGGGGFFGNAFTSVSIVKSVLSGNLVTAPHQPGGAGAYVYASSGNPKVTISGSTISDNQSASDGGGIVAAGNVNLTLTSDEIDANGAPDASGLFLFDKSPTSFVAKIVGVEFVGNVASNEGSGALEAVSFGGEQGSLTIVRAKITGNSGAAGAGILTSEVRSVSITNTVLSGNLATPFPLFLGNYISFGGAAEFQGPGSFTISGCSITGNFARDGGGLDLDGVDGSITKTKITGNFAVVLGGAINEQNNAQVTLAPSDVISGNVAPTDAN